MCSATCTSRQRPALQECRPTGLPYEHSSQAPLPVTPAWQTGPRKPRPETSSPLPQASAGHTGCPEWSSPAGWDLVSLGRRRHWGTFSPQRPPLRKPCTPRLPACLLSSPLRTHLLLHVFLYLWRGWERACHGRDPPRTWLLLLTRPRHPPQHRGQRFGGSLSWSGPGTLAARPASVGTLPAASPLHANADRRQTPLLCQRALHTLPTRKLLG